MNQVSLSTTAGKVFWASLLLYCVTFGGFYFTTQYTLNRINFEEQSGLFLGFKEAICNNGQNCSDIKYENNLVTEKKKYLTFVDVKFKDSKSINMPMLQSNYAEFMSKFPWYIKMQFNSSMEIKTINGKPFKAN